MADTKIEFVADAINTDHDDVSRPLGLYVEGVKVVGAQGATVADPTGGATVDAEARTAINAIIDRLQAHGLLA